MHRPVRVLAAIVSRFRGNRRCANERLGLGKPAELMVMIGLAFLAQPLMAAPNKAPQYNGVGINAVVMSADGRLLAAHDSYARIHLWSLTDKKLLGTVDAACRNSVSQPIAMSGNGQSLAAVIDGKSVKTWSLPNGKALATLEEDKFKSGVNAVLLNKDGKLLVAGKSNGITDVWSLPEGKPMATLEKHSGSVKCLTMSADGKRLATGSDDKTIKVWSLPEGKLLTTLEGIMEGPAFLVMSADGQRVAYGDRDTTIKIWSLPEGKLLTHMPARKKDITGGGTIYGMALSPNGKTLALGSISNSMAGVDNSIKLWSVPEGKPLGSLLGPRSSVETLATNANGNILASGDCSGCIVVWGLNAAQQRWVEWATLLTPKTTK